MLTEEEWRVSGDPRAMLDILRGNPCASDRKLRLYACACATLIITRLPSGEEYQHVVATAEKMAEGLTDVAEVRRASEEIMLREIDAATQFDVRIAAAISNTLSDAYSGACGTVADLEVLEFESPDDADHRKQYADLLRCIFGNPYRGYKVHFRPVRLDSAWRTSDVVALAKGIYDDRAFDRMPILADALQDAGCTNDDVLAHCRGVGPHARGCWVVDLVLGKG